MTDVMAGMPGVTDNRGRDADAVRDDRHVDPRPRANLGLRFDVRRLRLTRAADLWYAGSGGTTDVGTTFGFAGRRSNGSTSLGRMVEGMADWAVSSHVSVNGYLGQMQGGDVIGKTVAGSRLRFGYLETVVSF